MALAAGHDRRRHANNEDAVSPVIAVILMVAVTVVITTAAFLFLGSFGEQATRTPSAIMIRVTADSASTQIRIKHVAGETLNSQEYRVSITLGAASNSVYEVCTGNFEAGGEIVATTQTQPMAAVCTSTNLSGGTALAKATYHVVVIHTVASHTLIDRDVEIT